MGRKTATWRALVLATVVAACGGVVMADQGNASQEAAAKAAWGKISNDIKNETDLQTIIGMHDRFLSEYADSTLAETVSSSEDVYKALLKADAKKFRGKWVPAGQIEVIEKTWRDEALQAMAMYQAGNFKEAVEAAKKVEVSDKENGVALAIEGDADYQMKMLPAARGAFEKLLAIDAGNVLAENNLAVIAFDSRQMVAGMVHYSKALGAWGSGAGNVVLVDNVAEALQAYLSGGGTAGSPGNKNNAAYKELVAKAAGPEGEMIAEMEKKGLIRRGAIWVTATQQEKIMQDVSAVKYQMAILDKQYVDVQQKLKTAQQGLARANAAYQNAMNSLASMDGQMRSANGAYSNYDMGARDRVQNVLAQASQQQEACEAVLSNLSQAMPEFQSAAEKLKRLLATADQRYTGVQRIIEPQQDSVGGKKGADLLAQAARPTGVDDATTVPSTAGTAAGGLASLPNAAANVVKPVTAVVQTDVAPGVTSNVAAVTNDEGVVSVQVPADTGGVMYTPSQNILPVSYPPPEFYGPGLHKVGDSVGTRSNLPLPEGGGGSPYMPQQPALELPLDWTKLPLDPIKLPQGTQRSIDSPPVMIDPPLPTNGPGVPQLGSMVPQLGSMTPNNGSMTPNNGSMTPGGGSMTPTGSASMTPRGVSMTPGSRGSMTPTGGGSMTPTGGGGSMTPNPGSMTPRVGR